jgi:hypothetical protein
VNAPISIKADPSKAIEFCDGAVYGAEMVKKWCRNGAVFWELRVILSLRVESPARRNPK